MIDALQQMHVLIMLVKIAIVFFVSVLRVQAVNFTRLYERQLKSSYGFEILKHYHDHPFGDQEVKHFKGESLLFMAPWREYGIQLALKYLKKFDYFVPCYYDFRKVNNSIVMDTHHQFSEQYLRRAKEANPAIQILPRIFTHGMQGDVFFLASTNDTEYQILLNYVLQVMSMPWYDGVVFSSPFLTPNHKYPFSIKNLLQKIRSSTDHLHKKLFIVLDGVNPSPDQQINKKKAREIIELVDKVIIANYDCPRSNQGVNIPISPMDWIKINYDFYRDVYSTAKLTPKLIMAIPLYGYYVAMFGKYDPIEGKEVIEKLSKEKNAWLQWSEQNEECMIFLNKMEFLYYPCLTFLNNRLRYFESISAGVAAFQIGGGMEIHMQMF